LKRYNAVIARLLAGLISEVVDIVFPAECSGGPYFWRNGMDASHPVSVEHELPSAPVVFGREGPAAPGAVDNSAVEVG
jgi:hypothetical protein